MKKYFTVDKDFNIVYRNKSDSHKSNQKKNKNFSVVNYLNIGYYIITPLIAGVFLGLAIDRLFRVSGVFVLIFILLGMVASFYNLYRLYKNG